MLKSLGAFSLCRVSTGETFNEFCMFFDTFSSLSTCLWYDTFFVFVCKIKEYKTCGSYLGSHVGSMCQYQLITLAKDCKYFFEDMKEIRGVLKP